MTTALKYSEDYADPNADVWQFSNAGNPMPKPKDYKGPEGYYEYLKTVKKEGVHGKGCKSQRRHLDKCGALDLKLPQQDQHQAKLYGDKAELRNVDPARTFGAVGRPLSE